MKRFVEGADRGQSTLLPECLDEWVEESNSVRVIDSFVDALDLADLGFEGVEPAATGRPAYHPSVLLKLYIYGYLNRVQSSRRLEREAGRNLEVIWLLGRLVPDDKVIADFRKDNGPAIRRVCASFVNLDFDQWAFAIDRRRHVPHGKTDLLSDSAVRSDGSALTMLLCTASGISVTYCCRQILPRGPYASILGEGYAGLARRRADRAHSLPPRSRRAAPPIYPDLIYDRHSWS